MREIKFRVHDADTGEILAYEHFNSHLNWGYYWLDAKELAQRGEETICQAPPEYFKHPNPLGRLIRVLYTGLKDKNGKEIYTGDVLNAGGEYNYTVFYDNNAASFRAESKRKGYIAYEDLASFVHYHEVGIIGNLYENPELLEAK